MIFAYTHCPPYRWCPDWRKDAFVALGATSSSSHRFLAVEPYYRPAFGTRDLSLSSDFCLCGRYLRYPFVASLDLFPVRGSKSCSAVGSLRVPLWADLTLPSQAISLAEAQVLPTDGANCRVTIQSLGPTGMGIWSKKPRDNEFIESGP